MPELASLRTSVLQHMRSAVSLECYNTWFKDISILSLENGNVQIGAPNRYVKQWLESHYKKELLRAISALSPDVKEVELAVVQPRASDSAATFAKVLTQSMPAHVQSVLKNGSSNGTSEHRNVFPKLSGNLRLETFTVGKSNRVAHAAAQSVAESPAIVYNPLFFHGPHGLGKTHLLQGIGHLLSERSKSASICYTSCEEFTNAYVSAVQNKSLNAFRSRFRTCDALLIDDVQFLGGREKTQEEFLHTFDALRNSNKQIVICSDTAPREIKRLDAKLVARFQSGLVVRLDPPDLPLRVELLNAKARDRGLGLLADVAAVLASHIEGNVRELEGAVCKLMALAAADAKTPDRELAITALRDLGYLRSGPLNLQDVLSAVVSHCNVTADEIRSDKRHAALVRARHMGMYLSKLLTSHSVAEIGRFYGNRDHATVIHATRKLMELLKRDDNLKQEVAALRQVLGR